MKNFTGRLNIWLFFAVSGFLFLTFFALPVLADEDKYGFENTAAGTSLKSLSLSNSNPESLAQSIVQKGLLFVGIVFFLLVLYAGFLWLIARGQSQKVDSAKQILETAIIGLVIVSASYAISTYVFDQLTAKDNTADTASEATNQ